MKQIAEKIGQLFIMGFPGQTPPGPFLNFISEERIGGVIFFEENCSHFSQIKENVDLIKNHIKGSAPFIAIDQEGGRVSRLRGAPAEFRAAASYADDSNCDKFIEDYGRSAVFMDSLGFNLNLAPVADIWINEENSCLRDRCYGNDPKKVANFVRASIETAHASNLLSCLKHFPGLGACITDPHEGVSQADYDQQIWEQRERIPFAAGIKAGADLVMTSHILLPRIDNTIVTGSKKIIDELLKKTLKYDGLVISDDLSMSGASALGSMGERAISSFQAGHDLLLFGKDYDAAIEAYDAFVRAVERKEIDEARLIASLDGIAGLKFKLERTLSH